MVYYDFSNPKKIYIYTHHLTRKNPRIREEITMPEKDEMQFLDAQRKVEQTASVMEHLFRAPKPAILLGPILIISLIFGAVLGFDQDDPYQAFLVYGIFILAVPTYLSGFLSGPIAESLGGKLYLRRSMLLAFLCLLLICTAIGILKVLIWIFEPDLENVHVMIFGYSAIIWLRHLILVAISQSSHIRSFPSSIVQPALGYILIYIFVAPFGLREWLLLVLTFTIFLSSVVILLVIATAPMKKAFGVNGLSMLRFSLDHITEGGESGTSEVEDFFKSFQEVKDVHVGLVAFKKEDEIKSIMIVPSVHPGPFGSLGGSDLPLKLKRGLANKSKIVLVPHGSATHDLNLSSTKEKDKIESKVKELLNGVKYLKTSSKFIRLHDSMDVCAQVFGNGILAVHTSAPFPTDDVDYATGNAARNLVHDRTGMDSLLIDAHNCAEKGSGCVFFGTKKADQLIRLTEKVSQKAKGSISESTQAGYAQKTGYATKMGIGTCGIQVLVVRSGKQNTAYILFDGNNMVMGLREKIMAEVGKIVDDSEVLTTDNHAVNATIGGFNPVGLKIDNKTLINDAVTLVKTALTDLEEVEVGMNAGTVKEVNVFGSENITHLSSAVNSSIATMKITTVASLFYAVIASLVMFLFI
jgi:putative membrane protein